MEQLDKIFFDEDEQVVAILGQSYLNSFLTTGSFKRMSMVLSNKRLYVKSRIFSFFKGITTKEEDFNVNDLTGSSINIISLIIYRIIFLIIFSLPLLYAMSEGEGVFMEGVFMSILNIIFWVFVFFFLIKDPRQIGINCKGKNFFYSIKHHKPTEVDNFRKELAKMIDHNRQQMMKQKD